MSWDSYNDCLYTMGIDDCVRRIEDGAFTDFGIKLPGQPRSCCGEKSISFAATVKGIVAMKGEEIVHQENVSYEPSCIGISPRNK